MAVVTYTVTNAIAAPPMALHSGVNKALFEKNNGANAWGTLSDAILVAKVPNGAVITDYLVKGGSPATSTQVRLLVGATAISGTMTAVSSTTVWRPGASGMTITNEQVPYKVSLSDDAAQQFSIVSLRVTTGASATVSTSFAGWVEYTLDHNDRIA